jgi:hypothetical protein
VYYSSTPRYPQDRLCRAAIVLLLGDLLAARKISGINRWCTQCPIAASDIDNIQPDTWPRLLTGDEHRELAEKWKALDTKGRKKHFKKHSIRYSELLRLPYWDPVRFTVIELSHNLLSNNADHHLRVLFEMSVLSEDGLGDKEPIPTQRKGQLNPIAAGEAWETVLKGSDREVKELAAYALRECCRSAGPPIGGRKELLLKNIYEWVSSLVIAY